MVTATELLFYGLLFLILSVGLLSPLIHIKKQQNQIEKLSDECYTLQEISSALAGTTPTTTQ
jgi:excinuclease UvrABC helicase subunit UvrB